MYSEEKKGPDPFINTMPRRQRVKFPGAFYHVYNRGVEKRPIFLEYTDRVTFLRILEEVIQEFRLRVFAFCLMENHYHIFLQTPLANLDKSMHKLQGQYAQYINWKYGRVGHLFQGRYKSRLVAVDQYALALLRYIHRNPLETGKFARCEEYEWSSYESYLSEYPKWEWVETKWFLDQLHLNRQEAIARFKEFHERPIAEREFNILNRTNRSIE